MAQVTLTVAQHARIAGEPIPCGGIRGCVGDGATDGARCDACNPLSRLNDKSAPPAEASGALVCRCEATGAMRVV